MLEELAECVADVAARWAEAAGEGRGLAAALSAWRLALRRRKEEHEFLGGRHGRDRRGALTLVADAGDLESRSTS
jgi:hypothetical protein